METHCLPPLQPCLRNLPAEPFRNWPTPAFTDAVTVLVVDDEPMIRELLVMMLSLRGYKILTADSGARALALAMAGDTPKIDILITDLCMPGMSGPELVARLHAIRPGIPTIFISGHSNDEMAAMGVEVPEAVCVTKPFRQSAIDAAMLTLLGRAAA